MKQYILVCLLAAAGVAALAYKVDGLISTSISHVTTSLQLIPATTYQRPLTAGGGVSAQDRCTSTGRSCALALLQVINHERLSRGIPGLRLDWQLAKGNAAGCKGAIAHAAAMAESGTIWHQNPSYPAESWPNDLCASVTTGGQNVGMAYGSQWDSAMQNHNAMMAEGPCPDVGCPNGEFETHGHYLNLLNASYTRVGIGFASGGGWWYLVETFGG